MDHQQHPSAFAPATLILLVLLGLFGAIIGIQLLVSLGVTPNTSIIGALVAMIIARVPLRAFAAYRSIHVQNLAQSNISAATFGAANSLLMPIAVPFLMGRPDLVLPMFLGVSLAMLFDAYLLYRMFDTKVFPASGAWPPGVAAAEAIKAGDSGGVQARFLGLGMLVGIGGNWFGIPMSAFGVAFIGNVWALTMLGIGFLIRGYAMPVAHIDINALYIPHGTMIGAGVVALIQVFFLIRSKKSEGDEETRSRVSVGRTLSIGAVGYLVLAMLVALISGLTSEMSTGMLVIFVVYATLAAFAHELIVGIAAMHSGWFPAFAVALITLLLGMMIGFPAVPLTVLCGFCAATGPAFADMGYDLKAGYMLRGYGADAEFELAGRRQQLIAAMIGFVLAIPVVLLAYRGYFAQGMVPPVAKVFASTIKAGIQPEVAHAIMIWIIPGLLIQWLGGPKRQLGVMLATGLLIANPLAGWAVLVGIALRELILRNCRPEAKGYTEVFAAGVIAGDALYGFFNSAIRANFSK